MGIILPNGEQYMWRAIKLDNTIIDEFVSDGTDFKQTEFNVIQNSTELNKFGLVSDNANIYFNRDGDFFVDDRVKFTFNIVESDTKKSLLIGEKNNLMMYRTAEHGTDNVTHIIEYVFGYKIETDIAYVRVKFYVNKDKLGFRIEITGKKDTSIDVTLVRDLNLIGRHEGIQISKDKTTNISI